MAKDDEPADDLQPITWPQMADLSAKAPVARFDYGDAAQRAEMDSADEIPVEEPRPVVDEPITISRPLTRAEKRRKHRPLPT